MAKNYWAVVCPENAAPALWKTWLKESCVAIGWPPSRHHLHGPTAKTNWRKARERALKVKQGDIIIPYLLPNRFGVPGKVVEVAIKDEQWNPTVPKGGYENNLSEAELGRRINVEWLSKGVPGADQVAIVPRKLRTSGGEVKQTIESIKPERRKRFMSIISNQTNWRLYRPGGVRSELRKSKQAVKGGGLRSAPTKDDSSLAGAKLYIERARKAFPILVRQAQAEETIYYSDLADELGMSNPRNLNHVLGAIGKAIQELGIRWKERIPPLQCLVVNKNTGLPGEGIGWFVSELKDFKHRTREQRKRIIRIELTNVFHYRNWDKVLDAFGLKPLATDSVTTKLIAKARVGGGVGECEDHRRLKHYVANNPAAIGLSEFEKGETEYCFPSADRIDIVFRNHVRRVGVEVKGPSSSDDDLVRGLFQAVKYLALCEAERKVEGCAENTEIILVSSRRFSGPLKRLKNLLGVTVVDGVVAPEASPRMAKTVPLSKSV